MPDSQWVQENVPTLMRPGLLLAKAYYHFILTVLEIIFVQFQPWKLFNVSDLRLKSFARLWTNNGEQMSAEMPGPLLSILKESKGVILDIGPGSGELLKRFNPDQISAMYGAEPAADLHPGLLANATAAGFGPKYHALLCGGQPESLIPALHKSGVLQTSGTGGSAEEGIFDEICCLRVLCGVPHVEETLSGLYALLKPGGRMVVCEHVANPWRTQGSIFARLAQFVFTIAGWPFFMGGCELQRHTAEALRAAGDWETFDLEYVMPKDPIPFVVGVLTKRL